MIPDHVNCIDCIHFDMRASRDMAKQGYGVCAQDGRTGRFESATFNRTCRMFHAGPPEVTQKRRAWLEAEQARFTANIMRTA